MSQLLLQQYIQIRKRRRRGIYKEQQAGIQKETGIRLYIRTERRRNVQCKLYGLERRNDDVRAEIHCSDESESEHGSGEMAGNGSGSIPNVRRNADRLKQ